jgi:hypothetical protein
MLELAKGQMPWHYLPIAIDWPDRSFADLIVPMNPGHPLGPVDLLHAGTLNDVQREMVQTFRNDIPALIGRMTVSQSGTGMV